MHLRRCNLHQTILPRILSQPVMNNDSDLYEMLGVPKDASAEEIDAAYRRRARETHPDNGGNARAFKELAEAALILRDPGRRLLYDQTGRKQGDTVEDVVAAYLLEAFKDAQDPIRFICDQVAEQREQYRIMVERAPQRIKRLKEKMATFSSHNAETKKSVALRFIERKLTEAIEGIEKEVRSAEEKIKLGTAVLAYLSDLRSCFEIRRWFARLRVRVPCPPLVQHVGVLCRQFREEVSHGKCTA